MKKQSAPRAGEEKHGKKFSASRVMRWISYLALALLVFACCAVIVPLLEGGFTPALFTVPAALLLILSMAVKVFAARSFSRKIPWYVADSVLLALFTLFSAWNDTSFVSADSNSYLSYLVYVCVLTEFYISAPVLRDCGIMFGCNLAIYTIIYGVGAGINNEFASAFDITSRYFVALIVLTLHFVMFGFSTTVVRKNRQIEKNLRELEESRNELLRAYDKLQEAALIEERNRIAKQIHDTAGHSLTTVIMQTEAAKLSIDKDPEAARRSISAANLQAKNCLEQMRAGKHRGGILGRNGADGAHQAGQRLFNGGSGAVSLQHAAGGDLQRGAARRQHGVSGRAERQGQFCGISAFGQRERGGYEIFQRGVRPFRHARKSGISGRHGAFFLGGRGRI